MLPENLTSFQQKLMMMIYDSGFITKKEQDFYKSKFFYNRIGELIRRHLVKSVKNYSTGVNQYYLTERGVVLAKIIRGEKL